MRSSRGTGGAHAAPRHPRERSTGQARGLVLALAATTALMGAMAIFQQSTSGSSASGAVMVSAADARSSDALEQLVVLGHSIPSGVGASAVTGGYAALAAEATGLRLINHAY